MILISAGMPKAGTGWYFNLTNSLLAEHGGADVRAVRDRSGLLRAVTKAADGNCSMAKLRAHRMAALVAVDLRHRDFTVKTHSPPTPSARLLLRSGLAKATYCYRDLRDVALSIVDHRAKLGDRVEGRVGGATLEQSVEFAVNLIDAYRAWSSVPGALMVSYEDLRTDPQREIHRLAQHLGIALEDDEVVRLLEAHAPGQGSADWQDGLHFNRGEVGRFREAMTEAQLAHANRVLGPLLAEMGYEVG